MRKGVELEKQTQGGRTTSELVQSSLIGIISQMALNPFVQSSLEGDPEPVDDAETTRKVEGNKRI